MTWKALQQKRITARDLVGVTIDATLPMVPQQLFERTRDRCAADPEAGGAVPEDLRAENLFFYWTPDKPGCAEAAGALTQSRYTVTSSLETPTVYPELDQLVADGKLELVELFGQIEHGELGEHDLGWIAYHRMVKALRADGFREERAYPGSRGSRMTRRMPSGLVVSVDLLSPVNFADHADRTEADRIFREATASHEVVYYAGHAFYGSLEVLDRPDAYLPGRYQIVFMDACWSYAYYTKQVFRHKATPADPSGWALADVINNTEPSVSGSELGAAELWHNLVTGADAVHGRRPAARYSWNNLIEYMNVSAEQRHPPTDKFNQAEIYGVSGVRTNRFWPAR